MNNHRCLSSIFLAAILCAGFLSVPRATAQILDDPTTLHLGCTGTTICPAGSTSQVVTSAGNPTFQITTQSKSGIANGASGTIFLVILVPNPTSLGSSFSVNGVAGAAVNAAQFDGIKPEGKLEDPGVLNITLKATSNPAFGAFQSASAQVLGGGGPKSFTVYTVNLGTVTAPAKGFANGAVLATVNSFGVTLPAGTVLYGLLIQGSTTNSTPNGLTAVNTSPLSESLTTSGSPTPTPEPTSMLLFGSGFVFLGGVLRRRLNSRT